MDYSKIRPILNRQERLNLLNQIGRMTMHNAIENELLFREDVVVAITQIAYTSVYGKVLDSFMESVDKLWYPKYLYGNNKEVEIEDADDPNIKEIIMVEISESMLPILLFLPELILHLPPVIKGFNRSFWTVRDDKERIEALKATQKTLCRKSKTCNENDRKKIIGIMESIQKASDEYKKKLLEGKKK